MTEQDSTTPTIWVHETDEDHKRAILARAEIAKSFSIRKMRLSRLTLGLSMDAEALQEIGLASSPEQFRKKYLTEKESYYGDKAAVLGSYAASMTLEAPTMSRARSWLLRKRESYHSWRAQRVGNQLASLALEEDHVSEQPFEPKLTSIVVDLNEDGPLANDVMERVILPDGKVVLTGSGPVPRN